VLSAVSGAAADCYESSQMIMLLHGAIRDNEPEKPGPAWLLLNQEQRGRARHRPPGTGGDLPSGKRVPRESRYVRAEPRSRKLMHSVKRIVPGYRHTHG
jgi:hypothetical protein